VRKNCKKISPYFSRKIQNQTVDACFKIISLKITKKINDCKYFSIITDETADISGIKQLSLCTRYYDSNDGKMHEVFLKFVSIYKVNGSNLVYTIIEELKNMNIE
jgi:hypothetical protein